jgi:hypothetical protein
VLVGAGKPINSKLPRLEGEDAQIGEQLTTGGYMANQSRFWVYEFQDHNPSHRALENLAIERPALSCLVNGNEYIKSVS